MNLSKNMNLGGSGDAMLIMFPVLEIEIGIETCILYSIRLQSRFMDDMGVYGNSLSKSKY